MTENKRYVVLDSEEIYSITDTKGLKTLDDYIKEFSKEEYGFTEEEALFVAKEEYWQMIYENSMSATENVKRLNELNNENKQLKKENKELKTFKDKVFALIDARIEIYKHKPLIARVSALFSVNFDEETDRLARLTELKQLKKELEE